MKYITCGEASHIGITTRRAVIGDLVVFPKCFALRSAAWVLRPHGVRPSPVKTLRTPSGRLGLSVGSSGFAFNACSRRQCVWHPARPPGPGSPWGRGSPSSTASKRHMLGVRSPGQAPAHGAEGGGKYGRFGDQGIKPEAGGFKINPSDELRSGYVRYAARRQRGSAVSEPSAVSGPRIPRDHPYTPPQPLPLLSHRRGTGLGKKPGPRSVAVARTLARPANPPLGPGDRKSTRRWSRSRSVDRMVCRRDPRRSSRGGHPSDGRDLPGSLPAGNWAGTLSHR